MVRVMKRRMRIQLIVNDGERDIFRAIPSDRVLEMMIRKIEMIMLTRFGARRACLIARVSDR
jgi:hypothetical protein